MSGVILSPMGAYAMDEDVGTSRTLTPKAVLPAPGEAPQGTVTYRIGGSRENPTLLFGPPGLELPLIKPNSKPKSSKPKSGASSSERPGAFSPYKSRRNDTLLPNVSGPSSTPTLQPQPEEGVNPNETLLPSY